MTPKKIIIMGATSGIGLEVTRLLVAQGHQVAIAGRRTARLAEMLQEMPDLHAESIDINTPEAPRQLHLLIDALEGLDIYLHVSGVGYQNKVLEEQPELQTVETNTLGFARMTGAAFRYFAQQGHGQIAAVTSIAGTKGLGAAPAYSASKRFGSNYLEALNQLATIRGLNIKFTDIRPGFVDTDLLRGDYHYPMLMKPQQVAQGIISGVLRQRRVVTIDWRYRLLVMLWRMVPSCIWVKLKIQ